MCANVKAMQNFLKHLPVPVHHVVDSSQEATIYFKDFNVEDTYTR